MYQRTPSSRVSSSASAPWSMPAGTAHHCVRLRVESTSSRASTKADAMQSRVQSVLLYSSSALTLEALSLWPSAGTSVKSVPCMSMSMRPTFSRTFPSALSTSFRRGGIEL